ncbi:hypothetical protein IWZ03DRAFT_101080 [Phyllosticta citriasiana]|uniref:Uncharacterized protein n=1 Tax=Phyllosticta citriasiana TaxID=595635 RepID=A0ABR1KVV1_9PEZI
MPQLLQRHNRSPRPKNFTVTQVVTQQFDDDQHSNDDYDDHRDKKSSTTSTSTDDRPCGRTTTTTRPRSRQGQGQGAPQPPASPPANVRRGFCQRRLYCSPSTTSATARRWKRGNATAEPAATSAASSSTTTSTTSCLSGLRHSRSSTVACRGTAEPYRLAFCGGSPPARHRPGQLGQCADIWSGQERSRAGTDGIGVSASGRAQKTPNSDIDSDSRLYVLLATLFGSHDDE